MWLKACLWSTWLKILMAFVHCKHGLDILTEIIWSGSRTKVQSGLVSTAGYAYMHVYAQSLCMVVNEHHTSKFSSLLGKCVWLERKGGNREDIQLWKIFHN